MRFSLRLILVSYTFHISLLLLYPNTKLMPYDKAVLSKILCVPISRSMEGGLFNVWARTMFIWRLSWVQLIFVSWIELAYSVAFCTNSTRCFVICLHKKHLESSLNFLTIFLDFLSKPPWNSLNVDLTNL